jgi:hypothetical protein
MVCESWWAPDVGDITPGIPKCPFIMTNIYIIYHIIYAGILEKQLNSKLGRHIAMPAGLSFPRAGLTKPRPEYSQTGPD